MIKFDNQFDIYVIWKSGNEKAERVGLESDAEDDGADDENNYKVYECPGLAPTGDIDVCNPNFAAHP
ncbi:Pantothenate kinase [Parelaphostrongylus tenuis]|uniref:Pantothenate kinase n=1 Tax=Parelaphostrongylus tenuis TaxID=148309 RepID=A0AAD5M2N3_PARTN|nr:Pantothenate kinase [Parelaphostrongylus tenuis]